MLRRLHPDQPESFAFTPENMRFAEAQISKFPDGRQASAVLPLLWRAQEQEGWLSRPAIEEVGRILDMPYIRVLEVATFYFMFQLQPVGSVAHIQVCGTTSCMICGAEDLVAVCRDKIAPKAHQISSDGKFSWEEVECLGACANAPMAQIGKDYYEDLTAEGLADLIERMAAGEVPTPGSQAGRFSSEPLGGKTVLEKERVNDVNASVGLAQRYADTLKRIDGSEQPIRTPWNPPTDSAAQVPPAINDDLLPPKPDLEGATPGPKPGADESVSPKGVTKQETDADNIGRPDEGDVAEEPSGTPAPSSGEAEAGEKGGSGADAGETRESSVHDGESPLNELDEDEDDKGGSGR